MSFLVSSIMTTAGLGHVGAFAGTIGLARRRAKPPPFQILSIKRETNYVTSR